MPANPIFWTVLGAVAVGYVATLGYLYGRDARPEAGFHSGRVPGYSYTSGRNVGLDASVVSLKGGDWRPVRLETLHASDRTRIVFSLVYEIDEDGPERLRAFLHDVAEFLQEQSGADAVYLQASPAEEFGGRWDYVYSPDGSGWWGRERLRAASRSPLEGARIEVDARDPEGRTKNPGGGDPPG